MTATNSKPKNSAPVVVLHEGPSGMGRALLKLIPSIIGSLLLHGLLVGGFGLYLFITHLSNASEEMPPEKEINSIKADEPDEQKNRTFNVVDVDPAATEFDTDTQFMVDRLADVSVPGSVDPTAAVGILDGDRSAAPVTLPAPGGFGATGQGGALESFAGPGNSKAVGEIGGYGPRGVPLEGTFYGRSGATREHALRNGGGTDASEAAVAKGLKWLIRIQEPDGKWSLNSVKLADKDKGRESNDVAATAFGLLPLLAAGKTHKPAKDNPYDKNIEKALAFLKRSQNAKTGYFGGGMYAHGLATIAMCEAYGLTQDSGLRRYAQGGINLIVNSQHEGGGWRYGPSRAPGDTSVSGWQIMALKSGMMAGLEVPAPAVKKSIAFLDHCVGTDEGYGYTGPGSSPIMTAVGLLCRQYMQNWGPAHPRMRKGVSNFIMKTPPDRQNVYYYYYATQVMHHFGGTEWKDWNDKMREFLIKTQDSKGTYDTNANFGSWNAAGDPHGSHGGRLMVTSLNLLTLEVYYRYLPLYYRDSGYKSDKTVQNTQ